MQWWFCFGGHFHFGTHTFSLFTNCKPSSLCWPQMEWREPEMALIQNGWSCHISCPAWPPGVRHWEDPVVWQWKCSFTYPQSHCRDLYLFIPSLIVAHSVWLCDFHLCEFIQVWALMYLCLRAWLTMQVFGIRLVLRPVNTAVWLFRWASGLTLPSSLTWWRF